MKGRVIYDPKGTFIFTDWNDLVSKPLAEGRTAEAIATADAIIDDFTESCLRQLYSDEKSLDLINEIRLLRGRINFDGLILLEILKSKTAVSQAFVQKVRQFKKARDLVLHSPEGEYALVLGNLSLNYSTQEELDLQAEKEARKAIQSAYEIFLELVKTNSELAKNSQRYFTREFYEKNPRGKVAQQKFPKNKK